MKCDLNDWVYTGEPTYPCGRDPGDCGAEEYCCSSAPALWLLCRKREAERDEAIALLRAIWHSEGPDRWPDPVEFRRRVEALVGPPPPGPYNRPREEF